VLVSLPTPDVVEQVLAGEAGVAAGSAVRTVVDLSTTGPAASQRVGAALRARGIALVDAPVSGGVTGAQAGTLSVMASGETAAFHALMHVAVYCGIPAGVEAIRTAEAVLKEHGLLD
jgi:3-hydroxyisobutyrate dehydrogenase-like beta-hydroxyacid dehydrogenase